MVLAFSRLMFLRPVLKMDEQSWVESHVLAFGFFGGAVRRVVPDNLKTGVIKPDIYDPRLNRSYARVRRPLRLSRRPGPGPETRDKACATDCTSWLDDRKT